MGRVVELSLLEVRVTCAENHETPVVQSNTREEANQVQVADSEAAIKNVVSESSGCT